MERDVRSSLARLRPTITTVPYLASSSAVRWPMPEVGPVMIQAFLGVPVGPFQSLRVSDEEPQSATPAPRSDAVVNLIVVPQGILCGTISIMDA